ncbi:hypothetical protein SAMN05421736_12457 [Evansella caseinilytica]|uniref:ABC-2 type transport system permease protein n=1 Tax=Evansella caseinilytica TaxID=1503961 RepID=A0A1H3UQ47_9BACI|nr:ABC transporter permease [Evansella caseinilytica]SDZ64514.1 hypothetical protein SAMN05421736_12457 [Evansella caseinilytica]
MMLHILRADFKKSTLGMWVLVFLGPIGIFALQAVNYGVRYDWLMNQSDDSWLQLLKQINFFLTPALLLGIALLASLAAGIEHQTNAWRKLLTLPVSRMKVYISKFIMIAVMLFISTILTFIGTIVFGQFFGWEQEVPYMAVFTNSFYPFFAALPILAIQLWLSITMHNQGFPLTFGIMGSVISLYSYGGPVWIIWTWPHLENSWGFPELYVILGAICGVILLLLGMIDFNRRDVR